MNVETQTYGKPRRTCDCAEMLLECRDDCPTLLRWAQQMDVLLREKFAETKNAIDTALL